MIPGSRVGRPWALLGHCWHLSQAGNPGKQVRMNKGEQDGGLLHSRMHQAQEITLSHTSPASRHPPRPSQDLLLWGPFGKGYRGPVPAFFPTSLRKKPWQGQDRRVPDLKPLPCSICTLPCPPSSSPWASGSRFLTCLRQNQGSELEGGQHSQESVRKQASSNPS